jgi:hypothetical protein
MSETTTQADRDQKNGRFLPGNSGFGGRPKGARNRLGEAFLQDLRDSWNEVGTIALKRAAEEDPVGYCRIIAGLLPRSIDLNVSIDAVAFADKFRMACELLGNEPAPRQIRKRLPGQRVIEHNDVG